MENKRGFLLLTTDYGLPACLICTKDSKDVDTVGITTITYNLKLVAYIKSILELVRELLKSSVTLLETRNESLSMLSRLCTERHEEHSAIALRLF